MTTFVPTRDLTTSTAPIRHSRHLVPVGLLLAATSLSMIAFVQAVRPNAHDATTLVRDHSEGELWRMIGAGVLAGGWAQWIWSVLVGLAIFALLRARIGRASALGCVVATHFLPAVAVASPCRSWATPTSSPTSMPAVDPCLRSRPETGLRSGSAGSRLTR
jgi:hypothetical protein